MILHLSYSIMRPKAYGIISTVPMNSPASAALMLTVHYQNCRLLLPDGTIG